MKGILLGILGLLYSSFLLAETHIQHVIKNDTPFEFYYIVNPVTEVPMAFSCQCSGIITPNEEQICDCYSDLEANSRKYRLEYMKNISPTYRANATFTAGAEVKIVWTLAFDTYWDWIAVKTKQISLTS